MAFHHVDRQREAELADFHTRLVRDAFDRTKSWKLEKVLGNGAFGITMLVTNIDPLHIQGKQRLVLKRSIIMNDSAREEDLVKESQNLELMRGNLHHLQVVASAAEVSYYKRKMTIDRKTGKETINWLDRIRTMFSNPPINVIRSISHLQGPAVLLEYLENGDMLHFWLRLSERGVQCPNRFLWNMYLCLVRAVVGMAYPPGAPPGAPTKVEEIPQGLKEPGRFSHNDIALRNMMIGGRWLLDKEHHEIPIVKLIDYGMSGFLQSALLAVEKNLMSVARMMAFMIVGADDDGLRVTAIGGFNTTAVSLAQPNTFMDLDPVLRFLICRTLACEENWRPSLQETLKQVAEGAAKPASAYPPNVAHRETSRAINEFIQRHLYDAPI